MSIFDTIKNAIFGHAAAAAPAPAAPTTAPASSRDPVAGTAPATSPTPPATQTVDIEAVLNGMAQKSGQKLNWQQSIVDLMKLVGLDSSLHNRQQLAQELGYTGDRNDSASMNIWLAKTAGHDKTRAERRQATARAR